MKSKKLTYITPIALFTALAMPMAVTAQEDNNCKKQHQRYKVIHIGTLGGPASYPSVNSPGYQIISNSGTIGLTPIPGRLWVRPTYPAVRFIMPSSGAMG
jgi:hypothetical protein